MEKRSIISFIIILIAIVMVSGCAEDTSNINDTGNQSLQQNSSLNNNVNTANVKISPDEAKNIAKKYINQSGATPGDPVLNKQGNTVYVVPVIVNGNNAGEIIIDANTGENQGGIGGAK